MESIASGSPRLPSMRIRWWESLGQTGARRINPYLVPDLRIQRRGEATFLPIPEIPVNVSAPRTIDHDENSLNTFLRLDFAAASIILLPVIVDPVKATLSTSMWDARAAPPTGPRDGTVLTTPAGKLVATIV